MAAAPGQLSYEKDLCEILVDSDCTLVVAAAQKTDPASREKWLPASARMHARRGEALLVLNAIAKAEAASSANVQAFANPTSATVNLTTAYALVSASDYLKQTLNAPLTRAAEVGVGLEVDPVRLQRGQELPACQAKFREALASIVDAIAESAERAPLNLRLACSIVADAAAARFGEENRLSAVRESILMRMFVGAMSDPENVGVLRGPIAPAGQRALYVLSKAMANLATGAPFNDKWSFLQPFESTIAEHQPKITAFLTALATNPQTKEQVVVSPANGLGLLQEQMNHIERGIAQLFLQTGSPEARSAHVCTDAVDVDTVSKVLDGVKEKVKDKLAVPTYTRLTSLLKNWSDAKAKGTSVEAMMAATRETTIGRNLSPADQKLDQDAAALGAKLMSFMGMKWTDADELEGVNLGIMEGGLPGAGADHLALKGSRRINNTSEAVLAALYNLSMRNKWDPICMGGVTEVRKIGLHSRIIHLQCKSPKSDFVLLEHMSPPVADLGGAIAFASIDHSLGYETGYPRGSMGCGGFVVQPVTDSQKACRVTYFLTAKFAGVEPDDAWGPGMEIVCTLNQLEEQVKVK